MARTGTRGPATTAAVTTKRGGNAVDAWMAEEITLFGRYVKRQTVALWLLRVPALFPVLFIARAVVTLNGTIMNGLEADVLGSGGEAFLFLTLLVTPLMTITGQRWFVSLRRWYGVAFAITALTDATLASITTEFAGGVFGRLAGHGFLLVGLTMVCLAIPLLATGNNPAQRMLGRYWKPLHRLTYVIWGLLGLHLALLEGLGFAHGGSPPDNNAILHQRFYQWLLCSIPLLTLRLPPVKRWVTAQQKAGRQWLVYCAVLPLAALFILGFSFIVNEEIFKGISAITLHNIED
jgi:sulfoxide reductase heme-binding subunit YedZ